MDSLVALEDNLRVLLEQYQDWQQQFLSLQDENQRQRDEIMRTHSELVQLKTEYNHLETAYALVVDTAESEHRDKVKQRLTNLIAQIDRALNALAQ